MRAFYLLFITIFLLNSSVLLRGEKAEVEYIKLEKVAVSSFPEDLFIPDLGSISPDKDGNVFVFAGLTNREGCFVAKLDSNLKFIKKIGREGMGPGEYATRNNSCDGRITLDCHNNLYVKDANPMRLLIFDNDGNYKKEYRMTADYMLHFGHLFDYFALDGKNFICKKYVNADLRRYALLLNLDTKKLIMEYAYQGKDIRLDGINYSWFCFGCKCFMDTDGETGMFLLAESQLYRARLYDNNGNIKLELFDKNRKMGTFNRKEMEMIKDFHKPKDKEVIFSNSYLMNPKADRGKYNYLINKIEESKNVIADARLAGDRIYIFPVPGDISIKERFPVEIYDLKGKLLKKALFKEIPQKIWRNFVFFIELDEDDNPYIVKYRMLDIP